MNCGASNIASAVIHHCCDAANRPKVEKRDKLGAFLVFNRIKEGSLASVI